MLEKIKLTFAQFLQKNLQKYIQDRPPDFTVGKDYLRRWYLIPRNPFFNVYYHCFTVSDDDRASHDHMYVNVSFLLEGAYKEYTEAGMFEHKQGDLIGRKPTTLHRLELYQDLASVRGEEKLQPCWTLFITGPRVREWGFKINGGWMHWEEYVAKYGDQPNN